MIQTGTVIPAALSQTEGDGEYAIRHPLTIDAQGDAAPIGAYLAAQLGVAFEAATGVQPVAEGSAVSDTRPSAAITLTLTGDHESESYGSEGYELIVSADGIRLSAAEPAGLFWGVQTLRQLLPAAASSASGLASGPGSAANSEQKIRAVTIKDHPRFAYRGAMLDVVRHFFSVENVKRYIDHLALLKLNVLHLHLTDDQGWRLEIEGWPRLTEHGSLTQVGGGGGGFYTQDDYREIVAYAQSRFITIVPEIDLPGHTNAALSSYPELTCDGVAPELYEGIEVGFSSLCIDNERTYEFVKDVLTQVAALTPGPWIHIGGDEALATPEADFLRFIERASAIAAGTGKTVIGWHEMGRSASLPAGTIGEYWNYIEPEGEAAEHAQQFITGGGKLIMAPGDVAYLDMKYDDASPLGLQWAKGPTSLTDAYSWDPADIFPGIGDAEILGVEAPLWTETILTMQDIEYMVFPRIAAIAEIAWSPARERQITEFAPRVANFGNLLDALGINYHRVPEVRWLDSGD